MTFTGEDGAQDAAEEELHLLIPQRQLSPRAGPAPFPGCPSFLDLEPGTGAGAGDP